MRLFEMKMDFIARIVYMKKCKCGFKFAKPGEFRNCQAFITTEGHGGIICPKCQTAYMNGKQIKLEGHNAEEDSPDQEV